MVYFSEQLNMTMGFVAFTEMPLAPILTQELWREQGSCMDARRASTSTPTPDIVDTAAVRRVHEHPLANGMAAQLAETFKALADPTRVRMLHALSHAELCVGDLAAVLEMTESAVSHQLRLLRSLRVVRARRDGKLVFYTLDDEHVARLFQLSLEHLGHE
jgi:DNA-binding transcriptional ArsR family regulator